MPVNLYDNIEEKATRKRVYRGRNIFYQQGTVKNIYLYLATLANRKIHFNRIELFYTIRTLSDE